MAMEKYGVSNKLKQQKAELSSLSQKLEKLDEEHEKTADFTDHRDRMRKRVIELQIEIAEQ